VLCAVRGSFRRALRRRYRGDQLRLQSGRVYLEVGTILPRVFDATDTAAIERVVREEFQRWFGHLPNDSAKYEELAAEILRILELYRLNQ
jgi:hypothetical protein